MSWHVKATGAYSIDSTEGTENAKMIVDVLTARGWTLNAICGVLGNIQNESGMNPWRWQSDVVRSTSESPWEHIGYGLLQYTPAGKYINTSQSLTGYGPNFSDKAGLSTDGEAQLIYMDEQEGYYSTDSYPLSYAEFKASTQSAGYLAEVWLYNYERPSASEAESSKASRIADANTWYSKLTGYTPSPTPTPTSKSHKLPVWMMVRRRR